MTSLDPLSPPPPESPRFDAALSAWVMSRYADVMAAFRDPRMAPVGPRSKAPPKNEHTAEQARIRAETLAALSASRISAWQAEIEPLAHAVFGQLQRERTVDLVGDVASPWSLAVALTVTRAGEHDGEHLSHLAAQVSASQPIPSIPRCNRQPP